MIVHEGRMSIVFPQERLRTIRDRLSSGGRVVAAELAGEFGTSEDTIRRDLRELAAAGICRRVYGGALPLSPASGSLSERQGEAVGRKAALGRTAAALVRPHQIVLIEAGSTNLAIARALPDGIGLTVVTNAPSIALALEGRAAIDVVLIGGLIDWRSGGVIGAAAVEALRGMRADLCFLGACAVATEAGIGAFHWDEIAFKRAMIAASGEVAVAATTEKLATAAAFAVADLSAVQHLIVEADAPHAALVELAAAGPRLHVVESFDA